MKKLIALLIALMVIFTFVACGEKVEETVPTTQETIPLTAYDSPALLISVSLTQEQTREKSIFAYLDEEGQVIVEYVGEVKKSGVFDPTVLPVITYEIQKADFAALDGENVYNEGSAAASFYVYYGEEDFIGGGYTGTNQDIPQKFTDAYAMLDQYFQKLLQDVPGEVIVDNIADNVNADVKAEMEKIFQTGGATLVDQLVVEDVLWDEDFYSYTGLSSDGGIVNATCCTNRQIPATYSFVIVTVEDASYINAVAKDFASNSQWLRTADDQQHNVYIAYKGNMVLCVIGSGDLYTQSTAAIAQNEWTVYPTEA